MRILVACEYSGIVRNAFRAKGHDAISCDILPTEREGPHIQGDVMQILNKGWDMMIAFPPCTYLCNSGVRWLDSEPDRWKKLIDGAYLFRSLLTAPVHYIAIENPVMHKWAQMIVGRGPDCSVQPWEHGHGEVKRTCFWLKNLPPLYPTRIVSGREARIHKMAPGDDRAKERSRTYQGIADAMAAQWPA